MNSHSYRISLTADHFAALVRGEVVSIETGSLARPVQVQLALSDIGFEAMQSALDAAEESALKDVKTWLDEND